MVSEEYLEVHVESFTNGLWQVDSQAQARYPQYEFAFGSFEVHETIFDTLNRIRSHKEQVPGDDAKRSGGVDRGDND